MIRFNSSKVMGTPSYYVQQLFPNNIGKQVVKTSWTWELKKDEPEEQTKEKSAQVGLATWGTTAEYRNVTLTVDGVEQPLPGIFLQQRERRFRKTVFQQLHGPLLHQSAETGAAHHGLE